MDQENQKPPTPLSSITLREALRLLRARRPGLSYAKIASKLGVEAQTVGTWFRGDYRPRRVDDAVGLAKLVGSTPEEQDILLHLADHGDAASLPWDSKEVQLCLERLLVFLNNDVLSEHEELEIPVDAGSNKASSGLSPQPRAFKSHKNVLQDSLPSQPVPPILSASQQPKGQPFGVKSLSAFFVVMVILLIGYQAIFKRYIFPVGMVLPPPFGCVQGPYDTTVSGTAMLGGWATGNGLDIDRIVIEVDGKDAGDAVYGTAWEGVGNQGWYWEWDTTQVVNGTHHYRVKAIRSDGEFRYIQCGDQPETMALVVSN